MCQDGQPFGSTPVPCAVLGSIRIHLFVTAGEEDSAHLSSFLEAPKVQPEVVHYRGKVLSKKTLTEDSHNCKSAAALLLGQSSRLPDGLLDDLTG